MHRLAFILLCSAGVAAATPATDLPDPTRPPTLHRDNARRLSLDSPQTFVVSAIKIGADERKAIVNDQLIAVGDRVGEAIVVEIAPGTVVLDYLSERRQIRLLPFNVRRAPRESLNRE